MKKVISTVLAVIMIASACLPVCAAGSPERAVSESARVFDGVIESVRRVVLSKLTFKYKGYNEMCVIPELEGGYVPQGFCAADAEKLYAVTYYNPDGSSSIICLIDSVSGERVKTLYLANEDLSLFNGHAGGCAYNNATVYISNGNSVYTLAVSKMLAAQDYSVMPFDDSFETGISGAYAHADGEYLYVGEFYTYTKDSVYDTDSSHHTRISAFERSYCLCYAFKLSDIPGYLAGEAATPNMIFAMPNSVQGLARTADGGFALSISYGRNYNSYLKIYKDITAGEPDGERIVNEKTVPVYYMSAGRLSKSITLPPMLEGIDFCFGKLVGIFESGAEKYSDGRFPLCSVCSF